MKRFFDFWLAFFCLLPWALDWPIGMGIAANSILLGVYAVVFLLETVSFIIFQKLRKAILLPDISIALVYVAFYLIKLLIASEYLDIRFGQMKLLTLSVLLVLTIWSATLHKRIQLSDKEKINSEDNTGSAGDGTMY